MKKLFISQPMKDLTNDEILKEREKAIKYVEEKLGEKVEVIDSFFKDEPYYNSPVWYLGKSLELLATADVAYFVNGWISARGCRIEHQVCIDYNINIIM